MNNIVAMSDELDRTRILDINLFYAVNKFDLYGWISLMSQLIIINRALYVNKQQEGKICAIT